MKTKEFIRRHLPPGASIANGAWIFGLTFGYAFVKSLFFIMEYFWERSALFEELLAGKKILLDGAMMPTFSSLMTGRMNGFLFTFLALFILAALHYISFYQGSQSIYLMRRLPDRWELCRRTLTLPLCGIVFTASVSAALWFIYYGLYMVLTPAQCIPQETVTEFWSAWFRF